MFRRLGFFIHTRIHGLEFCLARKKDCESCYFGEPEFIHSSRHPGQRDVVTVGLSLYLSRLGSTLRLGFQEFGMLLQAQSSILCKALRLGL